MFVLRWDWASLVRDQAGGALGSVGVARWDWISLVRDQAGGVLTSAAVPRAGLGPATPPLCRYAEHTTGLILARWWAFHRRLLTMFAAPVLGLIGEATSRRSPKGGGQSRSQSTQAPDRTQLQTLMGLQVRCPS
jgi:hypothetical protein